MRIVKVVLLVIVVLVLTIVTQIGGFLFLISLAFYSMVDSKVSSMFFRCATKMLIFIVLYLLSVLIVVPPIAKIFGRVPLPILEYRHLQPGNIMTCILSRHYVKPALAEIAYSSAEIMNKKYPGVVVNYLDGNFPFIDKFPLFPHLSHNDGKKLDLSFQYNDRTTRHFSNDIPSFIGYGICEEPTDGEENKPEFCDKKGYWQYSVLRDMVPQSNKINFNFSVERTRDLVNSLARQEALGKIFIEPHLKARLNLLNSKIRFHGCQAVRHDDHIHIQLK